MEWIHKIGRRKTAVARVYLSEGKGDISINKKTLADYFPTATLQYKINQPLALTESLGKFDLNISPGVKRLTPYFQLIQSTLN